MLSKPLRTITLFKCLKTGCFSTQKRNILLPRINKAIKQTKSKYKNQNKKVNVHMYKVKIHIENLKS